MVHSAGGVSQGETITVAISERDVLKLILEFLENRRLHIAQLSLERETGLINGHYSDDVLFLRQLILDGQWDSALDFVEPLKELDGFRTRSYRLLITKYKYFELLCIKQEPGPLQDNEFTVEEIVECLRELEGLCESGEEFRQLCALLTLPKLSDHEQFRKWNPSSARMECFHAVLPIVAEFIDRLNPPTKTEEKGVEGKESVDAAAEAERLLQLVVKGLLYESAVDYCQAQAMEGKNAPKPKCKFTELLARRNKLSPTDLSLVSWLEVLGNEQFTAPFQQKTLDFRLDPLKKPKLEAQWTEQILATPIKPGGQFPYSLVPHSKLKSAEKQLMSQSMSASMASCEPGLHNNWRRRNDSFRSHSMSQSTFPSIGGGFFTIQQQQPPSDNGDGRAHSLGTDVMRQSQIISDMLSESSAPSTARRSSPPTSERHKTGESADFQSQPMSVASFSPPPLSATENLSSDAGAARQELEAIFRRNQLQPLPLNQQKVKDKTTGMAQQPPTTLAPVPELCTPGGGGGGIEPDPTQFPQPMIQSRLFQEFQANRQYQDQQPMPMYPAAQLHQQQPPIFHYMPHIQPQQQHLSLAQQQHYHPVQPSSIYPAMAPTNTIAPSMMPPIPEYYEQQSTTIGQPYQLQQPQQQQQQPLVMMRQHVPLQQQQQPNEEALQNNYYNPPPMSSRPTSMIIPAGQMQPSMMAAQPNAWRPRSYQDQPFPTGREPSGGITPSYSMMSTMQADQQRQRRGSLGDEEFLEESASAIQGDGQQTGQLTSIRFVPVCRYEDAQAIRAVAFHPSGGHFAIGTNSRQLLLCRYPDLNASRGHDAELPPQPKILLARPKQHRGSVYCATFSQTGEMLATGSNDKTIRLMAVQLDADKCRIGAELELQHVHDGTVRDLIFMDERLSSGSSSNVLVSGGAGNCQLCLTDCAAGRTFKTFSGHNAPILALNNWGSSTNFVSCSQDKTIRFWDLRASAATSVIWPIPRTSNSPVTSVCVDPSGKLLVSGHEDATIMLYDICGGRVVQLFRPHGDEVRTVRLSNAAYYLLSGSYDRRIVITDMRGNLAEPLTYLPVAEHQDKVIQCRWHPSDFVFLSTSADKTATLWALPPPPPGD